jgi:hypothetical protein
MTMTESKSLGSSENKNDYKASLNEINIIANKLAILAKELREKILKCEIKETSLK